MGTEQRGSRLARPQSMHYVYILHSLKDSKLYIGESGDLKRRISEHNKGKVTATKNRRPLELIYYESYLVPLDAKRRERFLKGGKGRVELKIQLKECFSKIKYLK
jgi:putative endonuclease